MTTYARKQFRGTLFEADQPSRNVELIADEVIASEVIETFTDGDSTPSVVVPTTLYKTANTGATTISDFDDGFTGQIITVLIDDANTIIDFTSSGLIGNGGADWTPASGDSMRCVYDGTDWYCQISGASGGGGLNNVVEDTTPQLGGNLDVQANVINTSTVNGGITLTPNGTGNVTLGNFVFDGDQTVGAGQDNYILTYDNGAGTIQLEAAASSVTLPRDSDVFSFNTSGTFADPGAGQFAFNSSTISLISFLYINDIGASGSDIGALMSALEIGDRIYIHDGVDFDSLLDVKIIGLEVDRTGWWSVVCDVTGTALPANGQDMIVEFRPSPSITGDQDGRLMIWDGTNDEWVLSTAGNGALTVTEPATSQTRITGNTFLELFASSKVRVPSIGFQAAWTSTSSYLEFSHLSGVLGSTAKKIATPVTGGYIEVASEGGQSDLTLVGGSGIRIQEKGSAHSSFSSIGQLWVKNDIPCTLWFTDDAGNDTLLLGTTVSSTVTWASGGSSTYNSGFSNTYESGSTSKFNDNAALTFGTDSDFTIAFNGTNTVLTSAVGSFDIQLTDLDLDLQDNELIQATLRDYSIQDPGEYTPTGTTQTLTYSDGPAFQVDLESVTGNITITLSGGPATNTYGQMVVKVRQDSATARTITWAGGTFAWAGGTAHPMTSTLDGISIYTFETWDGGTTWYGAGEDYS